MLRVKPEWTPLDVLETEDRYPGLIDDLFTYGWQHALIKQQLDDQSE